MKKLLDDNPLVTAALQLWFTNRMKEAVADGKMSDELKQSFLSTVISVEKLAPIIEVNPRSLFDFFDENEIYILPIMENHRFSATVNGQGLFLRGFVSTRMEAENKAVIQAFPVLEAKLSPDEQ
jgi:hypothetical protein